MLTDLECKAAIAEASRCEKPIKKFDRHGLYIHALPSGKAYFYFKYRYLKKERKISLGAYGLVSLATARLRHHEARLLLEQGKDPSQQRQADKAQAERDANDTFRDWGLKWWDKFAPTWSEDHAKTILRRIRKELFSVIGDCPITELSREGLLGALEKIEERESYEIAHRCAQYAFRILKFAIDCHRLTTNVADGIVEALRPTMDGYFPSMPLEELPTFIKKLERNRSCSTIDTLQAMECLMLTLVRTKELIRWEWSEIHWKSSQWIIPGNKMKKSRWYAKPKDHIVPLSTQVLSILKEREKARSILDPRLQSIYVFPSQKGPHKHMSEATINKALERMGYKGVHTGHGFRALGTGIATELLNYEYSIVDRQLAHIQKDSVRRSYDRATLLPQRTKMMQDIANHVDSLKPQYLNTTKPQQEQFSVFSWQPVITYQFQKC